MLQFSLCLHITSFRVVAFSGLQWIALSALLNHLPMSRPFISSHLQRCPDTHIHTKVTMTDSRHQDMDIFLGDHFSAFYNYSLLPLFEKLTFLWSSHSPFVTGNTWVK